MTRRTERVHARDTGAGSARVSAPRSRGGAAHAPRHRDRPLATGDRVALGIGIALAVLMLAWFAWRLTQTLARDRAVAPGVAPAPVMPTH